MPDVPRTSQSIATRATLSGSGSIGATGSNLDDPWFIGFGPIDNPKVAVAVTLEHIPNGYGGTYAAPIAAKIIQLLESEGH